jgi:hypothetical protein
MPLASSGLVGTATARDDGDAAEGTSTAGDRASGYLPPSAEECGVNDEQQWIDLCA